MSYFFDTCLTIINLLLSRLHCAAFRFMRNLLILLSIIPLLFIPLSSYSATPTSANKKNNKIIQKFINIDIRKLIDAIAKITKKNFAIDPQVRGNVTLIAESGIKPNALYRSFLSLLSLHGYVAVGDGDIIKIVPQAKARISMNSPHSSKWDTQVVTIKGVEANFAINLLRPLLTPGAQISVLNNTDKIIITDSVDKIKHIKNVIEKISSTTVTNYEMIKLKFSASKEMFDRIKRINPVLAKRIVADEKSNSLIITGDDNKKDEIRNIILDLDVQSPSSTSGLEVIYLIHADAKTLAPVIRKILTNENVVSNLASDTKTVQQSVPPNLRQPNISITNNNTNTKKNNKVSVEADERLNALIISGPTSGLKAAKIAIDKLDVKRAQVLIEAVIAELSTTGGINLGVDWASMNSSGVAALNLQGNLKNIIANEGNTANQVNALSNGINFGGGEFNSSTKNGWAFLVNALLTDGSSNVLSTPSILTLDNQEAEVVVGNEMSIETGKYTQTSTGATNPFTTYERKDVGVSLKVTPQIGNNGEIRLDILQEISGVVPNSANLQLTNKKKIKTQIQVKTGEAIALGGLISEKNVETESKVPLLGDIPFLGALFRYKVNSREKTNLVVFIRTLIVEDKDITSFTNEKYKEIATAQDKLNKRIYNWNNIDTQPNIRNLEKILTPPPELNK